MQCKSFPTSHEFNPHKFLQAVEFTTEMLVSPIQVGTRARSPQEVQQIFYRCLPPAFNAALPPVDHTLFRDVLWRIKC